MPRSRRYLAERVLVLGPLVPGWRHLGGGAAKIVQSMCFRMIGRVVRHVGVRDIVALVVLVVLVRDAQ
eukprot:8307016-Heterocapsa_arctica.AAC.1